MHDTTQKLIDDGQNSPGLGQKRHNRCGRLSQLLTALVAIVTTALALWLGWSHRVLNLHTTPRALYQPSNLLVVTLSFGRPQTRRLSHNCAIIAEEGHRFVIQTDNLTQPACGLCECRPYIPSNCECPGPDKHDCLLCEKLTFLADTLNAEPEMLYLDNDLLILKPKFLDELYARSRVHDVLAAHGHVNTNVSRYYSMFNSGLLFMRSLPGLDYRDMLALQKEMVMNNDQNVITRFIYEHYDNWDSLSLKWHCRFLQRKNRDIPPTECYTLHDRNEEAAILDQYNISLRTLP